MSPSIIIELEKFIRQTQHFLDLTQISIFQTIKDLKADKVKEAAVYTTLFTYHQSDLYKKNVDNSGLLFHINRIDLHFIDDILDAGLDVQIIDDFFEIKRKL